MCGLVGIAGDCSLNFKDIFTDLLVVDSLRGSHSTGAAGVSRWKNELKIQKQPGGPHNLITTNGYVDMVRASGKAFIGHNRFATVGAHTSENAHPFMFDHVVGAHNGTLEKYSHKALPDYEKYGTDSEAIFASINDNGLRKTVDMLQGAWALTWFDTKADTINFLRNDKRPLFYCYSVDRCTLVWASEASMLEFVLNRSRTKTFQDELYTFEKDEHYSWTIPDSINKKFDAPVRSEMKALPELTGNKWKWDSINHKWNDNIPFVRPPAQNHGGNGKKNAKIGTAQMAGILSTDFKKLRIKKFRPPYKDSHGLTINKKGFEILIGNGCVFCSDNNINWGDFIHPLQSCDGPDVFLCETCYMDDDITDIVRNLV